MTSVMTSMYDPQATGFASDAPKKVGPSVNIELYEMREDAKKKEVHLYPIVNPAALGFSTLPVSPVLFSNDNLHFFQPLTSQSLPLLESSEILSILGDLDLELELFTPTCVDQCATPIFSFLSPVSSSSTPLDPVPPNEQPNSQTRSITNSPPASPTTNVLIDNSIPFFAVYPESELKHVDPSISQDRTFVLLLRAPFPPFS